MRTVSLAAGAALAVAVLGAAGEAVAQGDVMYGYCSARPSDWYGFGGWKNVRPGERAAITDVFRFEHDSWAQQNAAFEQAWTAQVHSAHPLGGAGRGLFNCYKFSDLASAKQARDGEVAFYVNDRRPFHNSAWRPNGTAAAQTASPPVAQSAPPPPVSQSTQPAPEMPSLVVRDTSAEDEERTRQLNEDNARRNREAAEREAAARATFARQRAEYEAAMKRHREAAERYKRECEAVRAKGGGRCVTPM